MTPDPTPTGLLPLPGQTILSLRGADRLRFLNGQVTNDVRSVSGAACVQAAVLDAKGRLEAVCHIREIHDAYLVDAPPCLRELLPARLDRYLIADEVEIADLTGTWHLAHVLGTEAPGIPGVFSFPVDRFGVPGIDLLSPAAFRPDLPELDPVEIEGLRIRHGIPLWPHELHPGIFPAEAGLDRTAVSFDKGCYLGQEVVSRMKRAGRTNQHLVLLAVPSGTMVGTPLLHDGKEAGGITSVSPVAESDGLHLAIAYRRRQQEHVTTFKLPSGTAKVHRQLS